MTSNEATVGELHDERNKISVEWKITNYFSLSQKADKYYYSPDFSFSDSDWCITILPNGRRVDSTVEYVGLCLKKQEPVLIDKALKVKLGIKFPNGATFSSGTYFKNFYESTQIYGFRKFMQRRDLFLLKSKIAPEGTLIIFCVIECQSCVEAASQTSSLDSSYMLSHDLQDLFLRGRKSDVEFHVNSRTFRAHKLILEARSPVFAAMFQHDMKEKNSGIVNIVDCDSEIFRDFLLFVYTGKTENLSTENMTGLYALADKYQTQGLKELCIDFMRDNLTIDTVCDIVAIIHRHHEAELIEITDRCNEKELKKSAKEYLIKNIGRILPTQKWQSFMAENSKLAVEILMTFIPQERS